MNRFLIAAFIVLGLPVHAAAQSLGIFRWQTQPFCNVLVLHVTAVASAYRLEGTDDQCGGTPASVIGMAFPRPDGSIGVGLTAVFGGAVSLHIDATILPSGGFNGSWSDSVGRSGALLFTPGGSAGGSVRPVVRPVTTYGAMVTQPPNASDRGFSATVTADTGAPNDAAALYGHFGGALALTAAAPAGVRGDSASNVGVYGLTDTGYAVVGGAGTGIGVQGYAASGAHSIAVQAVHLAGGTALDIRNGALMASGTVRTAFAATIPANAACLLHSHPLLDGDPSVLLFLTPQVAGITASAQYNPNQGRWYICSNSAPLSTPLPVAVLVIKQGPV
jgi:hypothetical protein